MTTIRRSLVIAALVVTTSFGGGKAHARVKTFFAVLSGGNEVSASGDANAGDPNGYGSATVTFRNDIDEKLCFTITVVNISMPTAAHIHENLAGRNGPIVVPLTVPPNGAFGTSRGCVDGLDPTLGQRIRNTPERFYVNVHDGPFPAGAIRGQLF